MRAGRLAVVVGLAAVIAGCGSAVDFPVAAGVIEAEVDTADRAARAALRDLVDDSRERWAAQGIDAYEIEYSSLAYWDCNALVTVAVAPGRDVRPAHGECGDDGDHVPVYTIDGLFRLADEALAGDEPADFVVVHVDADLGYPIRVFVDWEMGVADEEVGASVVGFRPGP